jgi:hypothetical protein
MLRSRKVKITVDGQSIPARSLLGAQNASANTMTIYGGTAATASNKIWVLTTLTDTQFPFAIDLDRWNANIWVTLDGDGYVYVSD